jgi:hypothetical protein
MSLLFLAALACCILLFLASSSTTDAVEPPPPALQEEFLTLLTSQSRESTTEVVSLIEANPLLALGETESGESSLHLSCIYGDAIKVKHLLLAGANPNHRASSPESLDMTPLTWCCYAGYTAAVQEFVSDLRTNVNLIVRQENGSFLTALDIALKIGEVGKGVAAVLLESASARTYEQLVEEGRDLSELLPIPITASASGGAEEEEEDDEEEL